MTRASGAANPEESDASDTELVAQERLLEWYDDHGRDLPWRHTRDPYAILVSEFMLQQTQVDRVIPKYLEFLQQFPTLEALAGASVADVIRAWAPLGYNRRAVNLQRLAREVVETHGGTIPEDERALRTLPGVGRYTAAAVACFAFGQQSVVVDTNIRRVLGRLERREEIGLHEAERVAERYLPPERAGDWSQALMDLSATICRASSPACLICPLRDLCPSRGRIVREERVEYRTKGPTERFQDSDRYLRGRIVDLLRAAPPDGIHAQDLAASLALTSKEQQDRLGRLLHGLERDGLAARRGNRLSLPE